MTRSPATPSRETAVRPRQRSWAALMAFVVGLPLGFGLLTLISQGYLGDEEVQRYIKHHVEKAEVVLFCIALSGLLAKFWQFRVERKACRLQLLPAWDGRPVPAAEAAGLWSKARQAGWRWQNTLLMRRVRGVLDFVHARQSAADLDDHIRTLADNDAIALEGSYALIRFITWAIPILGFLGTVLGITQAITGVTPEVLEKDLSQVTDGLSQAFDATALGLGLTMLTMFLTFLVDRAEQGLLVLVDQFADEQLAHRFERTGAEGGEFVEVVRQNTQVLVRSSEQLVRQQAEVWARALAETDRQRAEVEQRQQKVLLGALETMLERTVEAHARRLADLEKKVVDQSKDLLDRLALLATVLRDGAREQQAGLARVAQAVTAQAEALAQVQDGEKQLIKVQEVLAQNLASLAGAGAFEQAVHSLTAAIHLLTARTVTLPSGTPSRLGPRPGAQAA